MCIYLSIFLYYVFFHIISLSLSVTATWNIPSWVMAMHCIYYPNFNCLCLWNCACFTWFSTGFIYALTWTPAVTMLGCYFEKQWPVAKALASPGEWIVTFLFTPFFQFLVDNYSWRGAMLVLGAVQLHLCVWCTAEATHCHPWWAFIRSKQTQATVPLSNTPWTTGRSWSESWLMNKIQQQTGSPEKQESDLHGLHANCQPSHHGSLRVCLQHFGFFGPALILKSYNTGT